MRPPRYRGHATSAMGRAQPWRTVMAPPTAAITCRIGLQPGTQLALAHSGTVGSLRMVPPLLLLGTGMPMRSRLPSAHESAELATTTEDSEFCSKAPDLREQRRAFCSGDDAMVLPVCHRSSVNPRCISSGEVACSEVQGLRTNWNE